MVRSSDLKSVGRSGGEVAICKTKMIFFFSNFAAVYNVSL